MDDPQIPGSMEIPPSDLMVKSQLAEAIKIMFNEKKIMLITDLSTDEIKLATRIFMIQQIKDIPIWKDGLNYYFELMLSKKRSSRNEILRAIEGTQKKLGLLDRILNRGDKA